MLRSSTDRRRQLLAVLVVFAMVVVAVVFRDRLRSDFLPLDRSTIGPNLVAAVVQAGLVLVAAVLLYPPWRRAAHRFFDSKIAGVHSKLDVVLSHHQSHARKLDALAEQVSVLNANHAQLHQSVREMLDEQKQ